MDSFRKWLYRPRRDDTTLLAQFYYADEELNLVASELDTFDGRKDPERCTALVNQLRHCQDKVVSLCMAMMEQVIPGERANRDFRAKFPDDVMQENLAGQLWFGAECLAAGSSILNRESESSRMRPLAKAVTKTIETVRNLLREQCLKPMPEYTEKIRESLKIFDRLFSEFELSYVSAMVPVKSPEEHEVLQCVVVLFSETVYRALCVRLITQDQVDDCDPALMFTIPRLAIVAGLLLFPDGPLNLDPARPKHLSHLFRPFRTLLSKIRELLWTMSSEELAALEKSLCSLEEPQHSSLTLPENSTYSLPSSASMRFSPDEDVDIHLEERVPLAYANTAYTSNFIERFLANHPDCRTPLTADANLLPQSDKRPPSGGRSSSERKRERDPHHRSGHRSSSSRTRLRQERLSDRFLAKLTGVEERPRARRRSKRGLSSSDGVVVATGALQPVQESTGQDDGQHGRRVLRPSTGDPYSAHRLDYLAQRRQAFFQQYESLQRQRGADEPPVPYQSRQFRDTIEQPSGEGVEPNTGHAPLQMPALPAIFTPRQDSDSDQDQPQLRVKPRRHRPYSYTSAPTDHHRDSDNNELPSIPRVPLNTGDNSYNDYYSSRPEPARRRSARHSQPNQCNLSADTAGRCSDCDLSRPHNCTLSPPTSDANISRTLQEQAADLRRVGVLRVIECYNEASANPNILNNNTLETNVMPSSTERSLSASKWRDEFNMSVSEQREVDDVNLSNTLEPVNRPTSIYTFGGSERSYLEEDAPYTAVVSIGECVSSAVAAQPTILGPHNLYQQQDMPAPDYDPALPHDVSVTCSAERADVFHEDTILEEADSSRATDNASPDTVTPSEQIEDTFMVPLEKVDDDALAEGRGDSKGQVHVDGDVDEVEATTVLDECCVDYQTTGIEAGLSRHDGSTAPSGGCESEGVGDSSSSDDSGSGSEGGVLSEDELNDEEVALALQTSEVAAAWRGRARFLDARDLIQRLFVCISGVADQLQTNYASDLRRILKTVFLLNQTPAEEEDSKHATDQDDRSTSNESESLSVESAEDALAGLNGSQPPSPRHYCRDAATPLPSTVCVPPSVFHDHALLQFSEVTQVGASVEVVAGAVPSPTTPPSTLPRHLHHQANHNSLSDSSPTSGSRSPLQPTTGSRSPQQPTTGSRSPQQPTTGSRSSPPLTSRSPPLPASLEDTVTESAVITSVPSSPAAVAMSVEGRRGVEEPPCWVPDGEAPRCMACGAAFTVLRRRHHCRNCGKVFCGACSQHAVPLTHFGIWKAVRVCNVCFLQYVTSAASAS